MRDNSTDYDYRSIACITEPEGLGPCESGTHVSLEGIVWQETCNGESPANELPSWKLSDHVSSKRPTPLQNTLVLSWFHYHFTE